MLNTLLFITLVIVCLLLYVWFVRPELILILLLRIQVRQAGLKEKTVQAGTFTWSYLERGTPREGCPSLLLVHGFSMTKERWSDLVKYLPTNIHVVIPDLPGHGKTDQVPLQMEPPMTSILSEKLNEFMRLVGLNQQPIHLAGISMGGAIATIYASLNPQNVAVASIICPAMRTPIESDMNKEILEGKLPCLIDFTEAGVQRKISMAIHNGPKLPRQILKGILKQDRKYEDYFTKLAHMLLGSSYMDVTIKAAENVTSPSQVIWGEKDQIIHISGLDPMKKALPNLKEVHVLPDCGHSVCIEKPRKLAKLLVMFREKYSLGINTFSLP